DELQEQHDEAWNDIAQSRDRWAADENKGLKKLRRKIDQLRGDAKWAREIRALFKQTHPELQEKLRANGMVRRLKKDVLKELPPKDRELIRLQLPGKEVKMMGGDAELQRIRAELYKADPNSTDYRALAALLQSKGSVAFEQMAAQRHKVALLKIPQVVEFVKQAVCQSTGGKLILFAHHLDVIDKLREGLLESSENDDCVLVPEDIITLDGRRDAPE